MDRDTDFEALAEKLNIYALANGMDLVREEGVLRLEWHRDRLERGILLRLDTGGTMSISALAWNHGAPESIREVSRAERLPPALVRRDLASLLQSTLEAANAL
jgi:hypothetical protein